MQLLWWNWFDTGLRLINRLSFSLSRLRWGCRCFCAGEINGRSFHIGHLFRIDVEEFVLSVLKSFISERLF